MAESFSIRKATSPAVSVDCSDWHDTSFGWTTGDFVQKKSSSPAILVDFKESNDIPTQAEIVQLCERLKTIKHAPALQQLRAVIDSELQAHAS